MPRSYCFIKKFDKQYIKKINKKVAIIYRNYEKDPSLKEIIELKNFCRKTGRKFLISKYAKIAFMLKLDGLYIPSFYSNCDLNKYVTTKKFIVVGSAHSVRQIKIKEKQKVQQIFLSPIFKTNKKLNFLGINRFNILAKTTKKKVIALGGINKKNIKKLNLTNSYGFAGISFFKK